MPVDTYIYVAWPLVALLFIVPLLIVSNRKNLHRAFTYKNLAATLSEIALVYGAMCLLAVILMAGSSVIEESVTGYRDILRYGVGALIMALYIFTILTVVFFYPALLLLTLIYYLSRKWERPRDS